MERFLTGPAFISVSKINQWVSIFTLCIWVVLVFHALPELKFSYAISVKHLIVGVVTAAFVPIRYFLGKTTLEPHKLVKLLRHTQID